MLFIFGDSHAQFSLAGLDANRVPHRSLVRYSITMHRIGRDGQIINYVPQMDEPTNSFLICYGEVDCRCHIGKQIRLGRAEDEVINELAFKYVTTIKNNIKRGRVIVMAITPARCAEECNSNPNNINELFPFIGTDDERVRYTNKMNICINHYCNMAHIDFFDPYEPYKNAHGLLKPELSDTNVHVKDTSMVLDQFYRLYEGKL